MNTSISIPVLPRRRTVAVVGNPNTGKSTIFNALTGFRQRVGNYPGVTVEKRTGVLRNHLENPTIALIDLPGTYSLSAQAQDEAVVLEVLLGHQAGAPEPDAIVVVVDASNLARNLFFTTQVLELGKPIVVALNMTDAAENAGLSINVDALSKELGVPVIPMVASKQIGVSALEQAIVDSLGGTPSQRCASFPDCVCAELDGLSESLQVEREGFNGKVARVEALQTLLDPGGYHEQEMIKRCGRGLVEELSQRRERIEQAGESLHEVEARVRYAWIKRVVERVTTRRSEKKQNTLGAIDRVLTHRVVGLLIFMIVMASCFHAIYSWAAPLMNAIDSSLAAIGGVIGEMLPTGAFRSLVVDGIIAGVGAILVFLPQILILFFFISLLEDCGYMARAAYLLDRWMSLLGLSGQSFIPLLSSFACAVPAILATRTIENRRDRFITILIAPLMSCSARLPVYMLMIGAFIPAKSLLGGLIGLQAVTILGMYLLGVVVAVLVAWVLRITLLKGKAQSFLMELPAYRWPSAGTVFYRVYEQGREFVVSAGTIIFAVTLVVWALGYYPRPTNQNQVFDTQRTVVQETYERSIASISDLDTDAADAINHAHHERDEQLALINREQSGSALRHSFLGRMGIWIEPVVKPLGWDWRIGTAAIASFPAREVVVATMGTLYNLGGNEDDVSQGLRQKLQTATWPDGTPVFNAAVAMSIMVFFSLCCQCGGTLAAIKRETRSWRWPLLAFVYMTALAYVGALATYQIIHPWI